MIQVVRKTRYLQSAGLRKSCGKDTRIKQRDTFRRRIFLDWIFWNICPLFSKGRNKRKMIKKGRVICPETRTKVIKMLTKMWLNSKVSNDFIGHLLILILILIFLSFCNATGDEELYACSEEDRTKNAWYTISYSEKRIKIVLTVTYEYIEKRSYKKYP